MLGGLRAQQPLALRNVVAKHFGVLLQWRYTGPRFDVDAHLLLQRLVMRRVGAADE